MSKKRNIWLRIFALVSFIFMVSMNALANILPINNITTGEVSDSIANLFAPAPITFVIWGLIYILLFGYSVAQLKVEHDLSVRQNLLDDIALPFGLSSIANGLWILAWHYYYILASLILIVIVLFCLMIIRNEIKHFAISGLDHISITLPFSIYFGWITVATIANVTSYLVTINFDGLGLAEPTWMVVILIIGLIIASITIRAFKDIAYGLVIIWAYAGIYLKHVDPLAFNGQYPEVILTTQAAIAVLTLVILSTIWMILKAKRA